MKKLLSVLLTILMVLGLVACSSSNNEETTSEETGETSDTTDTVETSDENWYTGPGYDALYEELGAASVDLSNAEGALAEIIEKGVITMATSPDYPPNEFVADDGSIKGSDIMLGQYIANSLGVDLEVETMDFNAVLTAVDTGKVDMGISGFGYKEDRAQQFELSIGYQEDSAAAHHTLIVLAENVDKYSSLADFAGTTIDAQANSLQEMYVTDQIPDATLQLVSTLDQAILELQTGKVDAVALDSTTAKNYAETSNGLFASLYVEKDIEFDLSLYSDVQGNVVACKKGETSLIEAINEILTQLQASGLYEDNLYADMYYAACDEAGVLPGEE